MGKFLRSAIVIISLFTWCSPVYSQSSTSKGTEFWTAYMANTNPPNAPAGSQLPPSEMVLYVTSDVSTTGNVTIIDGSFTQNFSVTAHQITTLTIPASAFIATQGIFDKGIHITTADPVAIYAHIFAANSSGATLLLPVNTFGRDYSSINYTQQSNTDPSYSTFLIIATEDNTTVDITPTVNLLDGRQAGSMFSVVLNKGQVYQGLATTDLTGTRITSVSAGANTCTKIAVFSGSTRLYIGCTPVDKNDKPVNNSSDNLFQQVYPTASWGKTYVTVPLKSRTYDIFRVVLSTPNTIVKVNGTVINASQFTNASYYEFTSTVPNSVTANQPVQVVQYAVTQHDDLTCGVDNNDTGDPEMIYLTPIEQTIDHVTLFSASNHSILYSFINVVIKTSAVPSFIIDGKHYNAFTVLPGNTAYSYAQIPVSSGSGHNIVAGTGFNAIAYGFGDKESYGYAAGTNLQDLNSFLALQQPGSTALQTNGCRDIFYNLVLTLPFIPTSLTWDLKNGTPPLVIANPTYTTTQKDGTTLYLFTYPGQPKTYPVGTYKAVATAINPNTDICDRIQQYILTYNVTDPPVPAFAFGDACAGDQTSFTDNSITTSAAISTWLWDFGDGQTSNLQNPTHAYTAPGDYTVSLTITDIDGCNPLITHPVHITAKPVALFTTSAATCVGENVIFTDKSTTREGAVVQWAWDFGDGQTSIIQNPIHTYTATGTYNIKLTVFSDNGCSGVSTPQQVTIGPLPVADFSTPDVCAEDAYAQFINTSTIDDGSDAGSTYLWDFGDPAHLPNTSTEKDGRHTYPVAGNYNVTLTVKSRYGCSISKTQSFVVNGANPVAGFQVENKANLCSSDDVIFDDVSQPTFGNITKIVWYYDYNNNPNAGITVLRADMPADKKYSHNYGTFNTASPKNYAVYMVVYSGETCTATYGPINITIYPNPTVSLPVISNVCYGASPLQLTADNNGYVGTGVFSGKGVTPAGLFTPAIAGVGPDVITYTFTEASSCSYTVSQTINVIADPTVFADSVVNLLQDNSVVLQAVASGNELTYKWTPSTGLNRDDILNPVASVVDDTRYTLTVTSKDGCTAQTNVFVKVLKDLIIPNTFTPNGDRINDTWIITYLDQYLGCTVDIFNRYGQKLYTSINYNVPWDGRYKGSYLPTGTYYYIINPRHGRKPLSGSVTIVR